MPYSANPHIPYSPPTMAALKTFVDKDAGAKAFMNAVTGGATYDQHLVDQHIAVVTAKHYQSSGALDYYLKTQGLNLTPAEKTAVKDAWKVQHAADLAAKKAVLHAEADKAAAVAKAEQDAAAHAEYLHMMAADKLEGANLSDALGIIEAAGGDPSIDASYYAALHHAFSDKYGMGVSEAMEKVAHDANLTAAVETMTGKNY